MSLHHDLQAAADILWSAWPEADRRRFEAALDELRRSGVLDEAVQSGEMIPDFALCNAVGTLVNLQDLLDRGPVVITFFHSAASPLCRLCVQAYHQALSQVRDVGVTFVAVSVEPADQAMRGLAAAEVGGAVLGDPDGRISGLFGLLCPIPPEVEVGYRRLGVRSLLSFDRDLMLPLVASYVVDNAGTAAFACVDVDPVQRAEPAVLVEAVQRLA
jgi:peroxiredoxin